MAEQLGHGRRRSGGRCYVAFGRAGKVYSSRGAPFRDERDARHVLEAIGALVAQGVDLRTPVDRWLPASWAAHRLERWLRRMLERAESGERIAGYGAALERWCAPNWTPWKLVDAIAACTRSTTPDSTSGVAWLAAERKVPPKTRWNVVAAMSAFLG